jgi:transcriptional regulator with XRE-family HTH domain
MGRSPRTGPKHLAKKLRAIRDSMQLSQVAMCERLGFKTVLPGHISEYERGKRLPPYLVLLRYARLAGISTDVLIDDKMKLPD